MHLRTLLSASVCTLAFTGGLSAQLPPKPATVPAAQPAPPAKPLKDDEAAKLLAQIEEMSKKLDDDKFGHNSKVIRDLKEAGASGDKSFALWLDAVKAIEYDGKNRNAGEFADWKRGQTKDPDRARDAALQCHVQWLTIVLMHCNARNDSAKNEAIASAIAYTDSLVDRIQKNDGSLPRHAHEDVLAGVIAKHLKLESSVTRAENSAFIPGDLNGIYEGMILPYFRDTKNYSGLMQAWNKRIEQRTAIAGSFKGGNAYKEKFSTEELPELRWGQARDMFQMGQEETAAQQMMALLRSNLAHKHWQRWTEELTALLKKEPLPAKTKGSTNAPAPENPAAASTPPPPPREPGKGFPGGRFPGGRSR